MPLRPGRRHDIRVFINYRKEDASGQAGHLYDSLAPRYGEERIFMDTDTISPGEDYREVLATAVGQCDVLVAVIGQGWLTATDKNGRRRLDNADDWVRVELESAFEQGVRVIPVLVADAPLLRPEELPESLEPLARRQAMRLGSSARQWRFDIGRLTASIEQRPDSATGRRRRRRWVLFGAAALVTVASVAGFLALGSGNSSLGKPGDIAFSRTDGIYSMNPDGTHVHRVFESSMSPGFPAWSPDAKHIAFVMNRDIWLLGPSGPPTDLTKDPSLYAEYPAWSPDGKQIVFAASGPAAASKSGLAVVSSQGGAIRFLFHDNNYDSSPSWSPDGNRIIFSTTRDPYSAHRGASFTSRSIYEFSISDGTLRPLADTPASLTTGLHLDEPEWSPDGKSILYTYTYAKSKTTCSRGCIQRATPGTGQFSMVAMPPASGYSGYYDPRWINSSRVLFGYANQLWTVPLSGGYPELLSKATDISGATVAGP